MHKSLPTGTVTFLFTDIESSTKLAQGHPETWESLRKQHDDILRNAIEAQNGYVFRIIGDAFCAAFPTAGNALHAALQSQLHLNAKDWEGPPIKVRMGIHTGSANIQLDGEYVGYLTLTRVQRVMSAAYGGQVLLSNTTAEVARGGLPERVALRDMGEQQLKGLDGVERLWQLLSPELPQEFPALQTLTESPHNLPVQLTSFIGREKEVKAIKQELDRHRLITLTGPGGRWQNPTFDPHSSRSGQELSAWRLVCGTRARHRSGPCRDSYGAYFACAGNTRAEDRRRAERLSAGKRFIADPRQF